jgi:hypothetical protein
MPQIILNTNTSKGFGAPATDQGITVITTTIEVGQLVYALSAAGVQKQLASLPGVHHADVNYVAGSATMPAGASGAILALGRHCVGWFAWLWLSSFSWSRSLTPAAPDHAQRRHFEQG